MTKITTNDFNVILTEPKSPNGLWTISIATELSSSNQKIADRIRILNKKAKIKTVHLDAGIPSLKSAIETLKTLPQVHDPLVIYTKREGNTIELRFVEYKDTEAYLDKNPKLYGITLFANINRIAHLYHTTLIEKQTKYEFVKDEDFKDTVSHTQKEIIYKLKMLGLNAKKSQAKKTNPNVILYLTKKEITKALKD